MPSPMPMVDNMARWSCGNTYDKRYSRAYHEPNHPYSRGGGARFRDQDTNTLPSYDESEMFSTIFDSVMQPISIQDSPNFTAEDKELYREMLGSDDDEPSTAPVPDPDDLKRWEV